MSAAAPVRESDPNLPDDVQALIGTVQYEEAGEFPVERGYIWTACASVENGNPLFWDDAVADEITGGPIAPPTMLSVWFRPHHWAPGRAAAGAAAAGALRPEGALRAARGGDDRQHDRLPRAGPPRRPHHQRADPVVGEPRSGRRSAPAASG